MPLKQWFEYTSDWRHAPMACWVHIPQDGEDWRDESAEFLPSAPREISGKGYPVLCGTDNLSSNPGSALCADRTHPCARAISRQMARPRPAPWSRRWAPRQKRENICDSCCGSTPGPESRTVTVSAPTSTGAGYVCRKHTYQPIRAGSSRAGYGHD